MDGGSIAESKSYSNKHHSFQHDISVERKDTSKHINPYSKKQIKNSENLRKRRNLMLDGKTMICNPKMIKKKKNQHLSYGEPSR